MKHNPYSGYKGSGVGGTIAAGLLVLTCGSGVAGAQSLGDVAQREAERRKQATSGRIYTNGDLPAVEESVPSPAPVANDVAVGSFETPALQPAAEATRTPGVEPVLVAGREKRDEQYWRRLTGDLKGRVAKANAAVAAQHARLAAIAAGPPTPTSVREREIISASLARLERDAGYHSQELARFTTGAQLAKVPQEWIR